MLIAGIPNTEIAQELRVHFNTITNWKKNDVFKEEMRSQRKELCRTAQNVIANKAEYAARRICEMIDEADTTRIQFAAAVKVYETAIQTSIEDFENRIEELEQAITREV